MKYFWTSNICITIFEWTIYAILYN